jgi:hypothetical protein
LISRKQIFFCQQRQVGKRCDVELRRRRFRFGENSVQDAFIAQPSDVDFYKRIFFLKSIRQGLAPVHVQCGIPADGSALTACFRKQTIIGANDSRAAGTKRRED